MTETNDQHESSQDRPQDGVESSNARAEIGKGAGSGRDLVALSPIEERLAEIIRPVVESMGYELIRLRFMGGDHRTLQVMVDRPQGGININECADISTALSAVLDVEDPIESAYTLEVSSPGLDRPLTRLKDFDTWAGFEAKLETRDPIDGRRRFRGRLHGTEGNEVLVEIPEGVIGLDFDWLASARLVANDELIEKMTKARKASMLEDLEKGDFDAIETEDNREEDTK